MLKPGKYICTVAAPFNGWFGEMGKNNTPFIRLPLVITHGPEKDEEVEWQGWLTDKSVERTCATLAKVFGWNGDMETLAKLTTTGPFVGKPCQIVCEEEDYEGKKSVKIKWLNPIGSGAMQPDSALALAKKLAERSKKAVALDFDPDLDAAGVADTDDFLN